jgi:hypothetical protein
VSSILANPCRSLCNQLGEDFLLVTLFGNKASLGRARLLVQQVASEKKDILEVKATTVSRS